MKVLKGCAIDYTLEDQPNRMLLHVCNDKGVMGAGIAKQIKNRIPSAFTNYMRSVYALGEVSYSDNKEVCNLHAQKGYGRDGRRYLDYDMLINAITNLAWHGYCDDTTGEYVIPYNMGCGLAGGDWETVIGICCDLLGSERITVVKYE